MNPTYHFSPILEHWPVLYYPIVYQLNMYKAPPMHQTLCTYVQYK